MYEDTSTSFIDWIPYIVRGGILIGCVIIFFIIMTIFSGTSETHAISFKENSVYSDELNLMKQAATKYYNTKSLPENYGEEDIVYLNQMINDEIISDFTKKDNDYNYQNSYMKITKTDDNFYTLKLQLDCNNKVDFIVTTIEK